MIIVSSGSGTVTNINTALPLSGGPITTSGTITTSMATNKLIGRSTAGTGVMEEITVGTGLTLSGGTLSSSGGGAAGSTNEIQFNNAAAFAASANLRWIISDNRLVLGTENTADTNSRMVVIGKGISTQNTFAVHNQTGTNNSLIVKDDARVGIGTNAPNAQLHIDGAFPNKVGLVINGTNSSFSNGSYCIWQNNGADRGFIYVADSGSDALRGIKISNPTAVSEIMVAAGNRGVTITNSGSFTNSGAFSNAVTALLGTSTPLTVFGSMTSASLGSQINHINNTNTVGHKSQLIHRFLTQTSAIVEYGGFGTELMVNTNAAHSGDLFWSTALIGTFAERMRLKASGNVLIGTTSENAGSAKVLVINNGTAPSGNVTDSFQQYSADIVAGNAAPHFRTENGSIIKIYQETTAVTGATYVSGAGANVKEDCTFDGYTIAQVVRALRNQGLLA